MKWFWPITIAILAVPANSDVTAKGNPTPPCRARTLDLRAPNTKIRSAHFTGKFILNFRRDMLASLGYTFDQGYERVWRCKRFLPNAVWPRNSIVNRFPLSCNIRAHKTNNIHKLTINPDGIPNVSHCVTFNIDGKQLHPHHPASGEIVGTVIDYLRFV